MVFDYLAAGAGADFCAGASINSFILGSEVVSPPLDEDCPLYELAARDTNKIKAAKI